MGGFNASLDRLELAGFFLNDYETVGSVTYLGKTNTQGLWTVSKLDDSTGQIRYATRRNNSGYNDYASAWAARASLTYEVAGSQMVI